MRPAARPPLAEIDFDQAPFLVIWETTQACDLACVHCRAEAIPCRDAGELSTEEAFQLMRSVRRFGRPLFVLTGGDPAKRPDVVEIVEEGVRLGLRMGITPSATPLLTPELLRRLTGVGLSRLAMSLDGATPASHDAFRRVDGSFQRTIDSLRLARELGLSTQVNTTITRRTVGDFDAVVDLLLELDISLWSVFFLVPMGRADRADLPAPETFEEVFHRMAELADHVPFDIKSTAAPQYRRVVVQRQVEARRKGRRKKAPDPLTGGLGFSLADGVGRARGVNEGSGFVFISHRGEIMPSGFLPLARGNVRTHDLVDVYRDDELFRSLRDPDGFGGKCGVCEFRSICGGSRARAYALTGDPLAAEPSCSWEPARWHQSRSASGPASRTLPTIPGRPT
ncbi:MAG: TIGR04053 family radical SAM/SPASM domain-containing protein [Gemmatimonadota bacterium]